MTTTALRRRVDRVVPARRIAMGIFFLLLGVASFLLAGGIDPGTVTVFGLTAGGSQAILPEWTLSSPSTLNLLATVSLAIGGFQLVRGFGAWTNWILAVVAGMFIFSFLVWAAAGSSLNLAGLLGATLIKSVPLTLGAMSGVLCERAGVVNIAIEGMMLMSAMVGTLVGSLTNLWVGLLCAVLAGGLMGLLHAWLSVTYKTDQIVSGTVINIFALGMTSFISAKFLQRYQDLNNPGIFQPIEIPLLSKIPFLGPLLFNNNLFVYGMFILLILLHIGLFYTRWGLRLRSVGEHPKAADTLGIDVFRTRYMAVILGGLVAGFAGAYFTLGSVGRFDEGLTAGRGFISLAAMIFGNWMPFGGFGAGLLFGFADALAARAAILGIPIPSEFLLMTPYIATMIVLAGVVGRGQMPAADGQPYDKE
ncbi:MAG TPA: ABC transporter permease [Anaerolineales bacterium]|jgi:simple sugar transport system permease protein